MMQDDTKQSVVITAKTQKNVTAFLHHIGSNDVRDLQGANIMLLNAHINLYAIQKRTLSNAHERTNEGEYI